MDDVVRECICDGFLNNCGYGDRKVGTNVPYWYTSTKMFIAYSAVPGEAAHPGCTNWMRNDIRPSDMRLDYLAVVKECDNV